MGPSPSARRFDARLRLLVDLRRLLAAVDGSDLLTLMAVAAIATGVYLVAGPGWALIAGGVLVALMTPIATGLRILIRGR